MDCSALKILLNSQMNNEVREVSRGQTASGHCNMALSCLRLLHQETYYINYLSRRFEWNRNHRLESKRCWVNHKFIICLCQLSLSWWLNTYLDGVIERVPLSGFFPSTAPTVIHWWPKIIVPQLWSRSSKPRCYRMLPPKVPRSGTAPVSFQFQRPWDQHYWSLGLFSLSLLWVMLSLEGQSFEIRDGVILRTLIDCYVWWGMGSKQGHNRVWTLNRVGRTQSNSLKGDSQSPHPEMKLGLKTRLYHFLDLWLWIKN